jgi:hypothetical protein
MRVYNNSVVLRNDGVDPSTSAADLNAALGVNVTVRVASTPVAGVGALASIFNIADVAIANPMQTDDKGNYQFKVVDGVYDVVIAEGTADEAIIASEEIIEFDASSSINDLSLVAVFETIDLMVNSLLQFPAKKVLIVKEDDSTWDVALSSGVTANGDNKRISVGYPTNSFTVRSPLVYDVIIAYGQSNAVGYAGQPGVPAVDDVATPTGNLYAKNYDSVTDSIISISNIMNQVNNGDRSRGNGWTAFANKWIKETGRGCIIVPCAQGGESINALSKGVGTGLTDYYSGMLGGYSSTVSAMTTQGYDIGETYAVFHQGETDQQNETTAITYRNALNLLAQNMIADIGALEKFGVFIVGCPDSRDARKWETVQSAQWAATRYGAGAGFTNNMAVISDICPTFTEANGDYNAADGTHYSQRGYNRMGEDGAAGLIDWVKQGSTFSGSTVDKTRQAAVTGTGRLAMKHVAAVCAYNGSAWVFQSEQGNEYTSSSVRFATSTTDSIRFLLSGKNPVLYDMNANMGNSGIRRNVYPDIRYTDNTTDWQFDVFFYVDLIFSVNVNNGMLFDSWPIATAASGTLVDELITVTAFDGVKATFTHPTLSESPLLSYYSSSSNEVAQCSVRAVSATSTTVATDGSNGIIVIKLNRLPVTIAQLEALGSVEVRMSATVSDSL